MNKNIPSRKDSHARWLLAGCLAMLLLSSYLLSACSQIDCPLNNRVYTTYQFMNSKGDSVVVKDTITISTPRREMEDSVIVNKMKGKAKFSLPISYQRSEDIFYFELRGEGYQYTDTIKVKKEDKPHFESVDCNPSFFHTIIGVEHTHNAIDSIVIKDKTVDYDSSRKHFYIYLRSSN